MLRSCCLFRSGRFPRCEELTVFRSPPNKCRFMQYRLHATQVKNQIASQKPCTIYQNRRRKPDALLYGPRCTAVLLNSPTPTHCCRASRSRSPLSFGRAVVSKAARGVPDTMNVISPSQSGIYMSKTSMTSLKREGWFSRVHVKKNGRSTDAPLQLRGTTTTINVHQPTSSTQHTSCPFRPWHRALQPMGTRQPNNRQEHLRCRT